MRQLQSGAGSPGSFDCDTLILLLTPMAMASYQAAPLADLPATLQRPISMESFHASAPFATEGPLGIKVVYHLPACTAINEYIQVVKAEMRKGPDQYVDVLYSPPSHWQSRHPTYNMLLSWSTCG